MRAAVVSLSLVLAAGVVASVATAQAKPVVRQKSLLSERARVARATVTLPELSCAGAVAGDRGHVVTAAHCVAEGHDRVRVRFANGVQTQSSVEYIDRDLDLAWLALDHEAAVAPLALAGAWPRAGERVLFVGRVDRPSKTQVARIEHFGRCPSLPAQPRSLFTSVKARPGDSGSPLVNEKGEVVGLIHGGAACHIAAPTAPLAQHLATPASTPTLPDAPKLAPPAAPKAPAPADPDARGDDWKFERTPNGFRFRWKFHWSFGS